MTKLDHSSGEKSDSSLLLFCLVWTKQQNKGSTTINYNNNEDENLATTVVRRARARILLVGPIQLDAALCQC